MRVSVDESTFEEGRRDGAPPNTKVTRVDDPTKSYAWPKVQKPSRPYQDEAWLRQELARLGSYAAVAREHGFRRDLVAAAGRSFGINVTREYGERSRLYWNEAWLRAELRKHGSYTAVAREHGFRPNRVMAAGWSFGLDVVREYGTRRQPYWDEEWLRQELARLGSYRAVAREHGFNHWLVSTAGRSLGIDVQREYGTRSQPYYDEAWLRAELRKHGSYTAVAREHGFKPNHVMAAGRSFGINVWGKSVRFRKPKHLEESWLREQLAELGSYQAVARKHRLNRKRVAAAGRSFGIDVKREYGERSRPYWDEVWLREQLEGHGSYAAVARAHGFGHARVRHAGRSLGIRVRPRRLAAPPYKDEVWLRAELVKHGSYRAVARAHALDSNSVSHAGKTFGIDVRREYWEPLRREHCPFWDEAWLRAELKKHRSYVAVAREHGFDKSRVAAAGRALGIEVERDYAKRQDRVSYPYWNEVWLRQHPAKSGTYSAVAQVHGFDVGAVAAAGRSFGIDVRREYWGVWRRKRFPYWDAAWLRAQLRAHGTLREVADQHGFAYPSVLAAARELGVSARAETPRRSTTPPYLDEVWLRAQLAQEPLVTRIAAKHGLAVRVIAAAVRKFGIDVQSEYWAGREA